MKSLTLSFLLAAVLAHAADSPSLSGKWQVHLSIAGNESEQTCTLTQKDNDLTGSCVTTRGTVQIAGKVDGKKVAWGFKSEYEGNPLTINFSGTLDSPNKIAGSVRVEEFSVEGEFTAVPAK
jgi:hypothetical protein